MSCFGCSEFAAGAVMLVFVLEWWFGPPRRGGGA